MYREERNSPPRVCRHYIHVDTGELVESKEEEEEVEEAEENIKPAFEGGRLLVNFLRNSACLRVKKKIYIFDSNPEFFSIYSRVYIFKF